MISCGLLVGGGGGLEQRGVGRFPIFIIFQDIRDRNINIFLQIQYYYTVIAFMEDIICRIQNV